MFSSVSFLYSSLHFPPTPFSRLPSQSASFASFTPQRAVRLIFSWPLSCSLCLSIYFTQSYLSLPLSMLPPALPSFIFHSRALPLFPPPHICFPIPLMDDVAPCRGASIRGAGVSLWRAISKPIPLIAIAGCCSMTSHLLNRSQSERRQYGRGENFLYSWCYRGGSMEKCISLEFGHVGARVTCSVCRKRTVEPRWSCVHSLTQILLANEGINQRQLGCDSLSPSSLSGDVCWRRSLQAARGARFTKAVIC